MLERLLGYIERAKHGSLGAAVGTSVFLFVTVFTILQAVGVGGSPELFLSLLLGAVLVGAVLHGSFLLRRLKRLENRVSPTAALDVRNKATDLEAAIPEDVRPAFWAVVDEYDARIRRLQDQASQREYPGKPVAVEGGSFPLQHLSSSDDDDPVAALIDDFFVDPFPVTNNEFAAFMRDTPEWRDEAIYKKYGIPYYLCEFKGMEPPADKWDHPVVWVNWFAAVAFCNWRSRHQGRGEVYAFASPTDVRTDFSKNGWRLPTEAEWEATARGGADSDYPWGGKNDPTQCNYGKHYRGTTSVGRFGPNALGIYDMIGNVKEWCHDWFADQPTACDNDGAIVNPAGPTSGTMRVFRGASWMEDRELLHFARRGRIPPSNTNPDFGFRCVRTPTRHGP